MNTATQSHSTFFIAGGTLPRDASCYVRREADEEVFKSLQQGEFCYILTPRQMGKSSIMIRTAQRLREAGILTLLVDLTSLGVNVTPDQWYPGSSPANRTTVTKRGSCRNLLAGSNNARTGALSEMGSFSRADCFAQHKPIDSCLCGRD